MQCAAETTQRLRMSEPVHRPPKVTSPNSSCVCRLASRPPTRGCLTVPTFSAMDIVAGSVTNPHGGPYILRGAAITK
jgi:hypothetical protein